VCSLRDIHKYGYVHNDLSLSNFMVSKTTGNFYFLKIYFYKDSKFGVKCKLIDFGLSRREDINEDKPLAGTGYFHVYYWILFSFFFLIIILIVE
jgi:serine/threonine protein kinase